MTEKTVELILGMLNDGCCVSPLNFPAVLQLLTAWLRVFIVIPHMGF